MTKIAISAGHGLYVRGASSDMMDEVDEARRVVARLETELQDRGIDVRIYWDDVSRSQNENLNRITDWHNAQGPHELDVSVHFNAYEQVEKPMGCEVLYVTQKALAAEMSAAIADSGFIDRGAKYRDDLFVLNNTIAPAILLEICFVDSEADAELYFSHFDLICESIANILGGEDTVIEPPPPAALFTATGSCSYFGGPDDSGVAPDEGLAFLSSVLDKPYIFLPPGTPGTEGKGLARCLNPHTHYIACRWNYDVTSKSMLAGDDVALVRSVKNPDRALTAHPADWGPAGPESDHNTGRVADLSPSLLADLGLETDDEVSVLYPYNAGAQS